jgi:tRNA(adenine34) deaminase
MKPTNLYSNYMANLLSDIANLNIREDIPVGAIILDEKNELIAKAFNSRVKKNDPTGHAEIEVIRLAGQIIQNWRLDGFTLIVTLEPCLMCAGAILQSRIKKVVFGAYEPKTGSLISRPNLQITSWPEIIPGILDTECSELLSNWFLKKRLAR